MSILAVGTTYGFHKSIKAKDSSALTKWESFFDRIESAGRKGYYAVGYVNYEAAPAFEEKQRSFGSTPERITSSTLLSTVRPKRASIPWPMRGGGVPATAGLTSEQVTEAIRLIIIISAGATPIRSTIRCSWAQSSIERIATFTISWSFRGKPRL